MLVSLIRKIIDRIEWRLRGSLWYYRRRGLKAGQVPFFSAPEIAEPHLTEIGNNVWITLGCKLINHDGGIAMLNRAGLTDAVNVVGKIVIRDNVFVGAGSIILGDVEIGPNAIIASGSVVTKDVPPNTVVGGCPAKPICTIDEYLAKYCGDETTLWIEREIDIYDETVRHFMTDGRSGKWAIRLREGRTPLTQR